MTDKITNYLIEQNQKRGVLLKELHGLANTATDYSDLGEKTELVKKKIMQHDIETIKYMPKPNANKAESKESQINRKTNYFVLFLWFFTIAGGVVFYFFLDILTR